MNHTNYSQWVFCYNFIPLTFLSSPMSFFQSTKLGNASVHSTKTNINVNYETPGFPQGNYSPRIKYTCSYWTCVAPPVLKLDVCQAKGCNNFLHHMCMTTLCFESKFEPDSMKKICYQCLLAEMENAEYTEDCYVVEDSEEMESLQLAQCSDLSHCEEFFEQESSSFRSILAVCVGVKPDDPLFPRLSEEPYSYLRKKRNNQYLPRLADLQGEIIRRSKLIVNANDCRITRPKIRSKKECLAWLNLNTSSISQKDVEYLLRKEEEIRKKIVDMYE